MDWNNDGTTDLITGERGGFLHVFIRHDTSLTGFWQYRLLDSTVLCVGVNSQPTVADWNGDGMKDLLVGQEEGYVRFYPNLTSDTWPGFQDFSLVEAGGEPIFMLRVHPYMVDLDQDGLLDLVCGSISGFVLFYRNVGSMTAPELMPAETLRTLAGVPIMPSAPSRFGSRCGFGDWNNDGIVDFLISGASGFVEVYLGTRATAVLEERSETMRPDAGRTIIVRGVLMLAQNTSDKPQAASLLNICGRRVLDLGPGANDLSRLAPGVYFVRAAAGGRPSAHKIVKQ